MAKREHYKGQSYIDWLKSLGCIVYAPLRTDLTELISGNSFIATGDGSYFFQDDWCNIQTPSSAIKTVINLTTDALRDNTSKDWVVMCEGQLVQISPANNSCRVSLFANHAVNSEQSPQYNGNCYPSSMGRNTVTNTWSYIPNKVARAYNYNSSQILFYWDGSLLTTASLNFNITTMASPYINGFTIGCTGHNNFRNCKFKIRDFMFFNKLLTLSEIRKIQGYE